MSLIPNLKDIPEQVPVEPGEYDLRVTKAKKTQSARTGRNGILLVCDIAEEDNALNLMHTLWFGNDGDYTADDDDKSNLMWRMVKEFLRGVGLDEDGDLELEDFDGLEFSAYLEIEDGLDEDGNQQYPAKNVIKRIT